MVFFYSSFMHSTHQQEMILPLSLFAMIGLSYCAEVGRKKETLLLVVRGK